MNRPVPINTLALAALLAAMVAVQGCSTVTAVNNGFKVVGAGVRVVSSTGDVIFDHDGDGE
jgi:hypothetical protein